MTMAIPNNRWGILYCPKHATRGAKKRWSKIEYCLRSQGISFDFVQSEKQEGGRKADGHAYKQWL